MTHAQTVFYHNLISLICINRYKFTFKSYIIIIHALTQQIFDVHIKCHVVINRCKFIIIINIRHVSDQSIKFNHVKKWFKMSPKKFYFKTF